MVARSSAGDSLDAGSLDRRIGPDDLLDISVFEAPELNRVVRVSGEGTISLPLLDEVPAADLTPRQLELALRERLRQRFILDPHVSVQVTEMQSRTVSVVGAVVRPGVLAIRGPRTLLEVLALAGGPSPEAGDGVIVMRGSLAGGTRASAAEPIAREINLKQLLESQDPRLNVTVHPGDVVKVPRSGMVYVVGEVNRAGAFPVGRGSALTVLQAVALGQGLGPLAAKGRTLIIRTTAAGERTEIPVDLGQVLAGKAADPRLQANDIVFVPSSALRSFAHGTVNALVRVVTLHGLF